MTEQEQLAKILNLVEQTNSRFDQLDQDIKQTNQRMESEVKRIESELKKWDERFFQLVKEQGQTARTIIIAAASVVVLSPVLGAVADFARHFFLNQ